MIKQAYQKRVYHVEAMHPGEVSNIEYYIDEDENEQAIIALYADKGFDLSLVKRNIFGDKTWEYVRNHTEGRLFFISNLLLDRFGKALCYQPVNLITGLPIVKKTTKYFYNYRDYDPEFGHQVLFEATYNSEGSLKYIHYRPDPFNEQDNESFYNFKDLQALFNEDLSYYKTADFFKKQ